MTAGDEAMKAPQWRAVRQTWEDRDCWLLVNVDEPFALRSGFYFSEVTANESADYFNALRTRTRQLEDDLAATQVVADAHLAKARLLDELREHFDPDHGEMCDGLCDILDRYDALQPAPADD